MTCIEPLAGQAFGAEAKGIDLSKTLQEAEIAALREALPRHRTIVFAEQSIEPGDFVRFSHIFGNPHPHVLDHLRLPGNPEILVLTNVVEDRSKPNGHNGAAFWHTDNSYEEVPASATMLHALKVPVRGGETYICDMGAAYRALPQSTRDLCDGLMVRHRYGNRDEGREHAAGRLHGEQAKAVPEALHPLVLAHPVTGERCLYAVAASARGIVGMPDHEALDLLNELKAHSTKAEFVVAHRYSVGEVFIWDTQITMHAAAVMEEARDEDTTRLMHRISVKGHPGLKH